MTLPFLSPVSSREITETDIHPLTELLARGLGYPSGYFLQVFERLTHHKTPAGFPKYGYAMMSGDLIVGAILLIFTTIETEVGTSVRCHVTSWYVLPEYRSYGALFFSKALKWKDVTYLNISARPPTLPFLKVQGFSKYSEGQFLAIPAVNFSSGKERAKVVGAEIVPSAHFETFERDLLLDHARYGCVSLWCMTSQRAYPFVFRPHLFRGFIPGAQLMYCRDVDDFVRYARPIGLFLARRGILVVRVDSNGPIPKLVGRYFAGMGPRYYRGGRHPRLGDLAYTQAAMCALPRRKGPDPL